MQQLDWVLPIKPCQKSENEHINLPSPFFSQELIKDNETEKKNELEPETKPIGIPCFLK